ncbi:putative cyclin-D6-1 [Trifolium repens]|nr:putative cyclin-D6-1 [Trifolium repens]
MASDVEFTILTEKEALFIRTTYFPVQHEFMPTPNFFKNATNILFRRHAVSIIAKHWRSIGPDTFIPYLAMNYFDRFFSMDKTFKEDVEGCNNDTEKVRLIAISCLSISAKLRIKEFSVEQFLRDNNLMITPQMIMRMEFKILHELRWKIRPVTPFTYLNFYYRYFRQFGGYKRCCINEIIVQAQGDHTFVHYPPTMIASTAFLAVSRMAYPTKYNQIAHPTALARLGSKKQVLECAKKIFNLCRTMKIRIEIPESGGRSALSKVMAVRQKQIKDRREKAAAVVDSSEEEEEEGGTALVRRKRNTGNTTGTSQVQVPVKMEEVVDKSDKKGLATEEIEAENIRAKEVVVDSSEEEEEDTTPLIRRKRNMGKTTETSQVQVPVKVGEVMDKGKETAVEVTETSVEDKARVEAIIRRGLENGKAVVGEEPQTQIGGSVSEILELVAPKKLMIFELKWPTEVPLLELLDIKQALPEVLEEEEEESQTDDQDTDKKKNRGCNIV